MYVLHRLFVCFVFVINFQLVVSCFVVVREMRLWMYVCFELKRLVVFFCHRCENTTESCILIRYRCFHERSSHAPSRKRHLYCTRVFNVQTIHPHLMSMYLSTPFPLTMFPPICGSASVWKLRGLRKQTPTLANGKARCIFITQRRASITAAVFFSNGIGNGRSKH